MASVACELVEGVQSARRNGVRAIVVRALESFVSTRRRIFLARSADDQPCAGKSSPQAAWRDKLEVIHLLLRC